MILPQEAIVVGCIARLHGKQGVLQCLMKNTYWEDTFWEEDADRYHNTFLLLELQHILTPFRVQDWCCKGKDCVLFQLQGVDNEQTALRLVGADVYMLRKDIPTTTDSLPSTWQCLAGYRIIDLDQGELGEVLAVDDSTINTLLSLNSGEIIPIHPDFIVEQDQDARILTIRLPYTL